MASETSHSQNVTPDGYSQVQNFTISYGPVRFEPAAAKQSDPKQSPPHLKKAIKSAGEFVQGLRTLFFNVLFMCLVLFLITLAVYFAFSRNQIVIETITVPNTLVAIGYTEDVAAHRLSDAIKEVEQAARVRRHNFEVLPESRQVDISIPEVGTLFDTALHYAKILFSKQDTTVAGEFVCGAADCSLDETYLRLRVFGERPITVNLPRIKETSDIAWEDPYFRQAAIRILDRVHPYFVAAYFFDRDPEQTLRIARRIIRTEENAANIALAYNLIGVTHLHRGSYDTAIGFFQLAIAKDDDFAEAHSNWGNALLHKNQLEDAIAKYENALRINPEFASAHSNIGDVLLRRNNIDGAIARYEKAIEIDPQNAYAYVNLGYAHTRRGQELGNLGQHAERLGAYDVAFTRFRDAIEVDPYLVLAHVTWADALINVEDYETADRKIEDGLRIAAERDVPNRGKTLAGLFASRGDLLVRQGNDTGAIIAYRKALDHRPDFTRALAGLGDAQLRAGQYEQARGAFTEAIRIRPDHVNALIGLGDTHFRLREYDQAQEAYRSAADYKPDAYRAHEGIGNVATRLRDFDGAIEAYGRAIAVRPDHLNTLIGLGNAHLRLKQPELAAETFEQAAAVSPDDHRPHEGLGNVALQRRALDEAAAHFERAVERNPAAIHSHAGKGTALIRAGEVPGAVAAYLEALRVNPDVKYIQDGFVAAVKRLPDWQSANEALSAVTSFSPEAPVFYQTWTELSKKHARIDTYPVILTLWSERTNTAEPEVLLGEYLLAQNDLDGATEAFRSALRTDGGADDPFMVRARNNLLALDRIE